MTSVVKCNTCNIVIDELLAYVQNKLSIIDEDTLIRLCVSSFKSDKIKQSKALLFQSIPTAKRNISRKQQGKENRDMEDIISLFKGTDPEVIPVFVARDLEKLPPITFDHLDPSTLLKRLLIVESELKEIKTNGITINDLIIEQEVNSAKFVTREEWEQSKEKFKNESVLTSNPYRNINLRRGAGTYLNSGPMGFSHFDTLINNSKNSSKCSEGSETSHQDYPQIEKQQNLNSTPPIAKESEKPTESVRQETGLADGRQLSSSTPRTNDNVNVNNNDQYCSKESFANALKKEGEWKLVENRKKRNTNYRYLGKTGICNESAGNFKAADLKVPIFITRVHKETTESDIMDYIQRKTQVKVKLEKITFKTEKNHNAYKFFIDEEKVSIFLDSTLWPQGIIFRRFERFRYRNSKEYNNERGGNKNPQ